MNIMITLNITIVNDVIPAVIRALGENFSGKMDMKWNNVTPVTREMNREDDIYQQGYRVENCAEKFFTIQH